MPLTKILVCSGIGILYITALTAQVAPPKNKTLSNVVGYQLYLQKQWNYNQLPKNSIQYRSDPKYIPLRDNKISTTVLHLYPITSPEVKNSFSTSMSHLPIHSGSYLQSSPILSYQWEPHSGAFRFYQQWKKYSFLKPVERKSILINTE